MPDYRHPGVYVEEVPNALKPIPRLSTSVTAFIGTTTLGPVNQAVLVQSFSEYQDIFGALHSDDDVMGFAVQAYFLNGGKSAYICRLVGDNSVQPSVYDFTDFYNNVLKNINDISIIVIPGQYWAMDGSGNAIIRATLAHCEMMKDRMAIIDLPPDFEFNPPNRLQASFLPSSAFAVIYYPWLNITNPFYNVVSHQTTKTLSMAPSSFASGIWVSTDETRGVWKAPAGINARLTGTVGLNDQVSANTQNHYNRLGINCIRDFPGAGPVIWGARTQATLTQRERLYVPVQRTAMMIEKSIYQGIQWAVFEPNDANLWSKLHSAISNFMQNLFREGALQGQKYADAFFVHCGLGQTMTEQDIQSGLIKVTVGFAPLKPAEFVTIAITLNTQGT